MPFPASLIPILAQLGTTALGAGANALFNKRPKVPDLSAQALAGFDQKRKHLEILMSRQHRDLNKDLSRRGEQLEEDLAAMGATGSGGVAARESLYRYQNDALRDLNETHALATTDLDAAAAEAEARAQAQEDMMRFGQRDEAYRNRTQAIGDLVGGVGSLSLDFLAKKYGFRPEDLDFAYRMYRVNSYDYPTVTPPALPSGGGVAPMGRSPLDPAILRALSGLGSR